MLFAFQPNTAASATRARLQNNPTLWIVALWVVCLVVTGLLTFWLYSYQQERVKNRFNTELQRATNDIQLRFEKPAFALMGTRGIYAASESVNRQAFQRYVESRDLAENFVGVQGMGFIERVQRPELGSFIQREQADGMPDFAVRSLGADGADLYVVKFIEPLDRNPAALGLDLGSEAARRSGVERAARSGQPTLSGAIELVQGDQFQPGFLIYVPVYQLGRPLSTPEQRLAALYGLAYSPVVLEDLLRPGMELLLSSGLHLQISDRPQSEDAQSLYQVGSAPTKPLLSAEVSFNVLGSTLFLRAQSTPVFPGTVNRFLVFVIGAAGALLSTLLAWVLWLQSTGRARAEAQAQRMTLDLQKLAMVAQHTANAVVMTDAQLRITWVNEGFTRICGYTAEDALGRTPSDLLGSGLANPVALQQLQEAVAQGVGCRVEMLNRAKDGRLYWLDTEVQPIRDGAGQLIGFVEIGLDVTEERQTNERLFHALLEAEAQQQELDLLARVARETTNAVLLTNTEGLLEWINEGFTRMTGYTLQEVMGEKPGSFLQCPETDPQAVARIREALAQRRPCQEEILNRSKDGQLYWIELSIQPLYDASGQHTGFMAIESDVTQRREALNRLQRLVQENQSLMTAINQGTIYSVADLQGNIVDVNDAFVRISGYEREELIGFNHRLLKSGAQPAELWSTAWATISSGQIWRGEVCDRNKSGELYWVNFTIVPFVGTDGRVEKYISLRTDITEQKLSQTEIESQRKRLDNILKGTRAGTWAWHVPSGRTVFNERWAEIVGCTLQELEPTTIDTWMGFAHPDDLQASGEALQQHFRGELDFYQVEARMRHRDGHWVWVHARGQVASREPDGSPGWMYGTHMDITKRKEAENSLIESQTLFRELLNVASDWYWETDDQYRFSNFVATHDTENYRALCHPSLGNRRWEMENVTPLSTDWATHIAVHERRESFRNFEYWRELPNGEVRCYAISGFPVIDSFGEFKGYRGTTRDATEQKRQEAELQTARDRMELAAESAGIGMWIFDATHHTLEWDDRMFQLYGQHTAPGLQPNEICANSLHPDDKASSEQALADALSGKKDFDTEFRILWPNGEVRHIRGTGRVQRDAQAGTVRMVGVNFDITEQKTQADALLAAKTQAEQASLFKSQFLANMSHEIRTPMNAILGMLKLMHNTQLQPRQLDYVQKTEGAAKSLLGLLNDILDFSKVEAGKMTLDPQPFELDRLMRDLSVIFSASLSNKPVEVLLDIDPRVPRQLVGDSLRLRQILINLGGNAIKFTAQGEVVVQVRLEALEGSASDRHACVRFSVQDSGIGIAPENQHKIFADFTQAEASTTRRFGGTGLGLSISRRLIDLMGGQLRLESAVGQGSTFSFSVRLPVVEASARAKTNATQPTLAPWCIPGLRVLVVDDNAMARELMANMGDSLGWTLETADSGEAALTRMAERTAQGEPYQAVFVDWMMPGLDGWQTSARIRSLIADGNGSTASPLIMMVTAHGREMLSQQTTEVQSLIDGYLVKPVTASMLFDAMQLAMAPSGTAAGVRAPATVVQPLAGLRILLVEDNAINQQVAEELLSGQGAAIDIADNGLRGVEAVQAAMATGKPYDAVLMDMQMPVMDGLTATREIRIRLAVAVADLPIIAMTANAMASDREACLAAGMNDHVGKPFDIDRLMATLLQWTRGASTAEAVQVLPPAVSPSSATEAEAATRAAVSDGLALLNRQGALQRVGGSTSLLNRLSVQFLSDLPGCVQACEAISQPDQKDEALRALHALKGVAATIGADALAKAAGEAEQQGRSGLGANLDHLHRVAAQTRQALLHLGITAPGSPATAGPTDGESQPPLTTAQREILERLLPLLEASDMSVFDTMEALLAHAESDPQRWAALDSEVQTMAFDRAAQRVRPWLESAH